MVSAYLARRQLLALAPQVDANRNGSLAHQEVKQSVASKEAKKILAQATSNAANSKGGQSVSNVQRWIARQVDAFMAVDTDRSGKLSAEELAKAPQSVARSELKAVEKYIAAMPAKHYR